MMIFIAGILCGGALAILFLLLAAAWRDKE